MDSADRSWEEIFREVSFRAKEFNAYKGEAETLPEGIILKTSLEQIEREFEALSDADADAKEKGKWLGVNWYRVFLPIIEKIIDQTCWICLGLFEYDGPVTRSHWIYFTPKEYESVLTTFSLIGRTDFFDKHLEEKVILSLPLYEKIQGAEIFNSAPFCIRLDEEFELPGYWSPDGGEFAVVADWHDALDKVGESGILQKYIKDNKAGLDDIAHSESPQILVDFLNDDKFNEFAKIYVGELDERGKNVADAIPKTVTNCESDREKIGNYLVMMRDSSKGEASLILTVPSWRPPGEKRRFRSVALIACFKKPQSDAALPLDAVTTAMELGSSNLSLFVFGFLNKELKKHATKSAIAAIMSRNGSHNIGSHVIYNVIKDIDMLNVQDNKYLFKYLQQRMDFVAQISTGWVPEWTSSSWLVKELMKGFFEQAHVLNYIAKSEGLQFDTEQNPEKMRIISKHVFKYKKGKKERKLIVHIELGEDSSSQKEGDEASGGANLDEDVPVAVPGGNIGFHAFYTIIENFIRNAAKHEFSSLPDKFKKHKNLRANIEIEEDEDRKAYTVRLWDNLSYISNVINHDEKADDNPFKIDDKKLQIADNNENLFKNLELKENEIKLIVIEAGNQVLTISIKDVQGEDLGIQCDTSETGPYCFVIHPYEQYGNKLSRPRVIPGFSELIKNPNIRFISQPRWEGFLSGFNEKDKTDNTKIKEKLKGLFEDNWLPIHCKINKEFGKDLINEDGSLRRESWGLSEMRISAGYLQKKEILDVGNGKRLKETNFIKAIAIPELVKDKPDVRAYRFGYEFKLLKPKEVLIVGVEDGLYTTNKRSLLEKESVFLEKDITKLNDFDYEFIVIVGDEVGKFLGKLMGESKHEFLEKFPYRIILAGNSNAKIVENDSFPSKRIAVCKEEDIVGEKISGYLSEAVPTENDTQSKNKNRSEPTALETLKLRVYEKWVEHLKCVCRGKDSSKDVYLVLLVQGGDPDKQDDKQDKDFSGFLKYLEKKGYEPIQENKDAILTTISEYYGFNNKTYKPKTLPEELYETESGDATGKPLAYSFNSKLKQLSLDSLKDFKGENHNSAISYLRHGHLCEEMKCKKNCGKVHKPIYDEYISGGANHFPIVANIPTEDDKPYVFRKMVLKLIENGLFKIAIADERCWDYLAERPSLAGELTRCSVYPVKKVLSFNMESPALEESCKIIEIDHDDEQIKITYEVGFAPDAIIIHQGILDKILWKDLNYENQEQFLKQLKLQIPFVAITSGRGEPSNLSKAEKFIGFSILEQHILSDPHSKLLLTDSFMKLSRGGEE